MPLLRPGQYEPLSLSESEFDQTPSRRSNLCNSPKSRVLDPIIEFLTDVWSKCTGFVRVNAGLLLVAASQAFLALMNVAVKELNSLDPPVPALELVAVRMGITYICCLSYLLWRKVPDPFLGPKGVRHLLVIRGFSGFFGLFGVYYSLQYLSLSDATVLTFLVPLTTAISGFLFLGEVFHRREAAAGVLSLLGVVLIARPEAIFGHSDGADISEDVTSEQRLRAVGVALLGVLGATGAYTSMRAIGKRAHTLHSMSYFSLWCVITSTAGMLLLHQKFIFPTRIEWLALLVMIGIFGFLAQALLTMGLQRETAGRGALAIYVQIIYATILERIFFHTVPPALSIIGTLIIMGSAVYVALTKQASQPSSTARKDGESEGSEGDVAFDLELGVAEPETQQRFLSFGHVAHGNNDSRVSLFLVPSHGQGQRLGQERESRKSKPTIGGGDALVLGGVGVGTEGFKSDLSLHVPTYAPDSDSQEGIDTKKKEADGRGSLGSQLDLDMDADTDTDDDDEHDTDTDAGVDEDRRRLLRSRSPSRS